MEHISLKEGWYWPTKDLKCWNWLQNEKDLPKQISDLAKEKRVMIQAGGNCGYYTKYYSQIFETVYTFEPDEVNFQCLVMNLQGCNVYKQQACLGDKRSLVSITTSEKNVGAYAVDTKRRGHIPTLMIDDLGLDVCDLIHLDIEGWEFPALKGGIETIKRCRPVIVLEWMNHGDKFGYPNTDIQKWLNELDYTSTVDIMHDKAFFPA
jgi:FkbM family methyltransferase